MAGQQIGAKQKRQKLNYRVIKRDPSNFSAGFFHQAIYIKSVFSLRRKLGKLFSQKRCAGVQKLAKSDRLTYAGSEGVVERK